MKSCMLQLKQISSALLLLEAVLYYIFTPHIALAYAYVCLPSHEPWQTNTALPYTYLPWLPLFTRIMPQLPSSLFFVVVFFFCFCGDDVKKPCPISAHLTGTDN